jgi:hypothetical protein
MAFLHLSNQLRKHIFSKKLSFLLFCSRKELKITIVLLDKRGKGTQLVLLQINQHTDF